MPDDIYPDVVIGHGRVTGFAAKAQVLAYPEAARVHFIHVVPEEIAPHNHPDNAAAVGRDRELHERNACADADVIACIGPLIFREASRFLTGAAASSRLVRIDPGMTPHTSDRQLPSARHVLLMGRADDARLKGIDIAAKAMAKVTDRAEREPPWLVIRGAPAGMESAFADEVKRGMNLRLHVRPYTPQASILREELMQASLVLMPSRAEGFGLVGLEAIGSAVPVLVSDRSGLAELLHEHLSAEDAHMMVLRVTGDVDVDAELWADRIQEVLADREGAFRRAERTAALLRGFLSWDRAVQQLLEALPAQGPAFARNSDRKRQYSSSAIGAPLTAAERLEVAVREPDMKRARAILVELGRGEGDPDQVLLALSALKTLSSMTNRYEPRMEFRTRAVNQTRKAWQRFRDPRLAVAWADAVVDWFYDRQARGHDEARDKLLRDAKEAIDSALTDRLSLFRPAVLAQKSSVLGCQAMVTPHGPSRDARIREALTCAQVADRETKSAQVALLALGQAEWMAARWPVDSTRYREHMGKAETALRRARGNAPTGPLVLARFLRLTHRPLQALREYVRYADADPNVWRRRSEAHIAGESVLYMYEQGFPERVVSRAARVAQDYLQDALLAGTGTARTHIAIANTLAVRGLARDGAEHLARLKRGSNQDWVSVMKEAMRLLADGEASHLDAAFVDGVRDPAFWSHLGSYTWRFMDDAALAREFYETANNLRPENPEILANLARALAESDLEQDVIRASELIEVAERRSDRTWPWWRPVHKRVNDSRQRFGLPPLSSAGSERDANREAYLQAYEAFLNGSLDAESFLRLIARESASVYLDGDIVNVGDVWLRLVNNGRSVGLIGTSGQTALLTEEDFTDVVNDRIGLASLVDRATSEWHIVGHLR